MSARTTLTWLQQQWLRVWLRCRLQWAEAEVRCCADRIQIAEAEAAYLPSQLDAYEDAAADLRTRLVALGGLPVTTGGSVPKPAAWPDAPPPRRWHP